MSVHLSPCFRDVRISNSVTVGECRPLSKMVHFNMLKVNKDDGTKKHSRRFLGTSTDDATRIYTQISREQDRHETFISAVIVRKKCH
ncbi:hypothetical protein J1605_002711 [Eschrichtius robustus]|uniref:40S ribosomal protein S11 n=1 Tax=Eschrichtius robustus TaxID=9764 RepID=A0AB34I000_ESCRO|nr:hypothetical protein J1605_002711 [Eschrichtius robustus]